ncbi:MAG TPA: hypothetical protein VF119_11390 [Candidatus Limnocylindrales bacterium]
MPMQVDAYASGGLARGVLARSGHLRDVLDSAPTLDLERVRWRPIDGPEVGTSGTVTMAVDDVLIAFADDDPTIPVHAAWHPIRLEVGPYVVEGELPTMPGFDPGRALTRPTGEFVQLRDVRISVRGTDSGLLSVDQALVNRYAVERVDADLMLGFFFPGAALGPAEGDVTGTTTKAATSA